MTVKSFLFWGFSAGPVAKPPSSLNAGGLGLIPDQGTRGFPDGSVGKESTCNTGDPSSIPGSGRSLGEGISYLLQYSGLENSMDCIVHRVAKSQI